MPSGTPFRYGNIFVQISSSLKGDNGRHFHNKDSNHGKGKLKFTDVIITGRQKIYVK